MRCLTRQDLAMMSAFALGKSEIGATAVIFVVLEAALAKCFVQALILQTARMLHVLSIHLGVMVVLTAFANGQLENGVNALFILTAALLVTSSVRSDAHHKVVQLLARLRRLLLQSGPVGVRRSVHGRFQTGQNVTLLAAWGRRCERSLAQILMVVARAIYQQVCDHARARKLAVGRFLHGSHAVRLAVLAFKRVSRSVLAANALVTRTGHAFAMEQIALGLWVNGLLAVVLVVTESSLATYHARVASQRIVLQQTSQKLRRNVTTLLAVTGLHRYGHFAATLVGRAANIAL